MKITYTSGNDKNIEKNMKESWDVIDGRFVNSIGDKLLPSKRGLVHPSGHKIY